MARKDEPNLLARSLLFLLFCEVVLPLDTCASGIITERSACKPAVRMMQASLVLKSREESEEKKKMRCEFCDPDADDQTIEAELGG